LFIYNHYAETSYDDENKKMTIYINPFLSFFEQREKVVREIIHCQIFLKMTVKTFRENVSR